MNAWRQRFAPRVPAAEGHGKWAEKTFREERAPIERPGLLAR